MRKAKYEHEKRVAKDVLDNSKHFWRYTRNKTRVNEVVTKVRNNEGVLTKNDTETAEVMNEAFNSVYVREDQSNVLPALQNNYQGNTLSNIVLSRNKLLKKIKKLETDKACGPDGISPFILNKFADILCDPLLQMFQCSLDFQEVPLDWRRANISSLFKKGSRNDPLNYRPVSLTSVVSKLFESLIRDHVVDHLMENGILANAQHGFRSKLCYKHA